MDLINSIIMDFNDLTVKQMDSVDFLIRAKMLSDNVEYIASKPFKADIEVVPFDLPREIKQKREKLDQYKSQKKLLDFKDNLIWSLYRKMKEREEQDEKRLENEINQEIKGWSTLVDKYSQELMKFRLICFYCGTAMQDETINAPCAKNFNAKLPENCKGFDDYINFSCWIL